MYKVAILKSRIYRGGVAQVIGYMILSLNQRGIIPEIITLRCDLSTTDFENLYNIKIKFKLKIIGPDLRMPYEWHFLFYNLISRKHVSNYDFVINSNNTSFLCSSKVKSLTYIHFPRKYRVSSTLESIHYPEKGKRSFFDIANDPFFLSRIVYSFHKRFNEKEIIVANSLYTKQAIEKVFDTTAKEIHVLYPPVKVKEPSTTIKNKKQIVTLGRISNEKRQLEQIEIAAKLPDLNFYILGFSEGGSYYKECVALIEKLGIKNVFLKVNLSEPEIQKTLEESQFFLHNVRNEPFGISIVQALSQGCIPIVHNSGGASEIVKQNELMFQDIDECVSKIGKLMTSEDTYLRSLLNSIDISLYSTTKFLNDFQELYIPK